MIKVVFLDCGKVTERLLEESAVDAFVQALESRGGSVLKVERASSGLDHFKGREKLEAWSPWFAALSRALHGGVPLQIALEALQEAAPNSSAVASIRNEVLAGRRFSDSVRRNLARLPSLIPALLQGGEASGDLAHGVSLCRRSLEGWIALKREMVSRLSYPLVVVVSAGTAISVLLLKVFPAMAGMWANLGKPVPPRLLLIRALGWLSVALLGLLGGGLAWIMRGDESSKSIPGFRKLGRIRQRAELWTTLSMTLSGGVSLPDSLTLLGNRWGADVALSEIKGGARPEAVLSRWVEGDRGQRAVLMAGLKVGDLAGGAEAVAEGYREMLNQQIESLQRRLEPAVLLLLGVILMGMAWGLFSVMGEMEHGLV